MKEDRIRSAACMALIICMGFLFTSTGWISWLYRIVALDPTLPASFITIVCGYVVQALGVGTYALLAYARSFTTRKRLIHASLVLYALLLIPSTAVGDATTAVACGLIANIPCGFIQGAYLHLLAERVHPGRRGTVFGCGYAISTLLSWVLSLPAGGVLTRGIPCLGVCCLTASLFAVLLNTPDDGNARVAQAVQPTSASALIGIAGATIVTSSLIKTAGFSFPATDLNLGVDLELSRLLYGLGLVVAGLASDRDRRYGLLFCSMALVMPFLMLALSGYGASGALLWSLGYFLTGFYTLFRVLLMVDLADSFHRKGHADEVGRAHLDTRASAPDESGSHGFAAHLNHTYVAVSSLLLGRIGDALGTALSLSLSNAPIMLIAVSAMLFVVTMALFLLLYQRLYAANPTLVHTSEPVLSPGLIPARATDSALSPLSTPASVPASASAPARAPVPESASDSVAIPVSVLAPLAATAPEDEPPAESAPAPSSAPKAESAPEPAYASVPESKPTPTPALVPQAESMPTSPVEPRRDHTRSERVAFERFASTYGLTARERDVLRLVLDERSNPEIAGKLFISEATVKYHVGNLLKKTACSNRLEILALYARTP